MLLIRPTIYCDKMSLCLQSVIKSQLLSSTHSPGQLAISKCFLRHISQYNKIHQYSNLKYKTNANALQHDNICRLKYNSIIYCQITRTKFDFNKKGKCYK